jgi:FtsH-binding integral membrane protein
MTESGTDCMSKLPEHVHTTDGKGEHNDSPRSRELNELPRQFSLFSTLAFGFSMTNSWLGYSATFITPLLLGGSPTVFFGLIAASIACCFISRRTVSRFHHENPLTLFQRPAWLSLRQRTPPAPDSIILSIWSHLQSIVLWWLLSLDG